MVAGTHRPLTLDDYARTVDVVLSSHWAPDLPSKDPLIDLAETLTQPQKPKKISFFLPTTIHTTCKTCKKCWPFNPDRSLGITEPKIATDGQQWFYLAYQCQSCKGVPIRFLVRRQGKKLKLCGRDPIEEVLAPDNLPKDQVVHFSNAILAYQSGQTLAGIFFLRVFVEQFWRSHPAVQAQLEKEPRMTGEAMGQIYSAALPKVFKSQFPSLGDAYSRLSACIHSAKAEDADFETISSLITDHFAARRLVKLK